MAFTFTINGHTYTSDPTNVAVPEGYRFIGYGYMTALPNLMSDVVAVAASVTDTALIALGYKNDANNSANAAAGSAGTANTKANEAGASAGLALTYRDAAQGYAAAAAASAAGVAAITGLPVPTIADAGKAITVNAAGAYVLVDPSDRAFDFFNLGA